MHDKERINNMKNAVVFGAAGHTGKYITRRLMRSDDISLMAFVRDLKKFGYMDITGVNVVCGDALNEADVKKSYGGSGYTCMLT